MPKRPNLCFYIVLCSVLRSALALYCGVVEESTPEIPILHPENVPTPFNLLCFWSACPRLATLRTHRFNIKTRHSSRNCQRQRFIILIFHSGIDSYWVEIYSIWFWDILSVGFNLFGNLWFKFIHYFWSKFFKFSLIPLISPIINLFSKFIIKKFNFIIPYHIAQ